jgi:hypothetical protein
MNKAAWIVIGIIAVVAIVFFIRQCKPNTIVVKPVDSVFYWKDKYNNEVASMKGKEEQFGYQEKVLLDSIAKIHNVNPDKIKEYVTVYEQGQTQIVTRDKPIITYVDSGKGKEMKWVYQTYRSPYYLAEATIDVTGKDSSTLKLENDGYVKRGVERSARRKYFKSQKIFAVGCD